MTPLSSEMRGFPRFSEVFSEASLNLVLYEISQNNNVRYPNESPKFWIRFLKLVKYLIILSIRKLNDIIECKFIRIRRFESIPRDP